MKFCIYVKVHPMTLCMNFLFTTTTITLAEVQTLKQIFGGFQRKLSFSTERSIVDLALTLNYNSKF